jgi:hypothetical protein
MALKTNFTDDILAESMNGKRQYNVTENSNGTKSLEDVTNYQSVGSTFSAKDMNETNAAVNQAYDDMGDEFNPKVDYAVGDYTIRNNKVWKFTTAHPAGAWDESHVKATKILSEARELTEKILAETVDFGVVQINAGSTTGLAIPKKDGYTIASATPYSNSGSESTQTNVITFVNAVSGAKKAFYKNTSSSAISNRLMVDVIYVKV